MTKQEKFLSYAGQQRRDQMLVQLQTEVKRTARRRVRRRAIAASIPIVLFALGIWWSITAKNNDTHLSLVKETNQPKTDLMATGPFAWENVIVGNRDGVVDRYIVHNHQVELLEFEALSDDELLDLLAEVGKPSVLGRINGEFAVISVDGSRLH